MFVRAYKLAGAKIAHGCNTIWRDGSLCEKGVLASVAQLRKGDAVFLRKEWTDKDRGNKFYGDAEGNMSHIGLVVSVKPLRFIDASYSAGRVRETDSLKKVGWNRYGRLRAAGSLSTGDFGGQTGGSTAMGEVLASSVNMRSKPSKTSRRLGVIPCGEKVTILTDMGTWWKIDYKGQTAYVMAQYLRRA